MLEENSDSPLQMSDLTEEDISPRTYTPGEIVEGQVVRVDPDGIVVQIQDESYCGGSGALGNLCDPDDRPRTR